MKWLILALAVVGCGQGKAEQRGDDQTLEREPSADELLILDAEPTIYPMVTFDETVSCAQDIGFTERWHCTAKPDKRSCTLLDPCPKGCK